MASTLTVDNIVGATSSSSIHIPGHVIQVVQALSNTEFINTTTTFADSGLLGVITPTSASSKILVNISAGFFIEASTVSSIEMHSRITRNGTAVKDFNRVINIRATQAGGILGNGNQGSLVYLDSPSTTSAVTYKLQICSGTTGEGARINKDNIASSAITLMEIAQ